MNIDVHPTGLNPRRSWLPLLLAGALTIVGPAFAAKPGKDERKEDRAMKREFGADDPSLKPKNRDLPTEPKERKAGAADSQGRPLARLREQMEVEDDDEWAVIARRIEKLDELRRGISSGAAGSRGVAATSDRSKRASGNVERDSLRAAVSDKLPEAEIKGRLARAREAYRQDEERLATAQSELRAVLTVRQEAIAVVAGLLPP